MSLRMEDRRVDSGMMSLDCTRAEKITQLKKHNARHFILKTVLKEDEVNTETAFCTGKRHQLCNVHYSTKKGIRLY